MQACLNRLNAGRISGDASSLCLGELGSGGNLQLPSDPATGRKAANAEDTLEGLIDARCATDTSLAALDTCAGDQTSGARDRAKQCLRCTNWRRAVEIIGRAYGPN
jgi:hypothetical protein